jgi:hypothetical protein
MLVRFVPAQSKPKAKPKGPRAMGLLQLAPNGKAHLIPITILYDGEFYDASAYKASPVPMALESGTVYEAMQTGVSQGLFTIGSALHGNNTWIGEGTWQSTAELAAAAAAAAKKKEARSKPAPEPVEGPPVLRRSAAKAPQPAPSPSSGSTPAPTAPAPAVPPPAAAPAPAPPVVAEDPDRPRLKRGAPSAVELKKQSASTSKPASSPAKGTAHSASPAATTASAVKNIPAISDADGPDPRPYAYSLKPDEEDKLRKKLLALAADEVRARAAELAAAAVGSPATPPKTAARTRLPQPSYEDTQFHAFDLSNSNEPILVLTTKARMPARPNAPTSDLQYIVTVVARDDIYGELHKAFTSITDTQHLDVLPRVELVDAVDADGDGRGELLFRQTSDAGHAFVLYRVIGDRLWPLFQGTPGQ